ncbi:hypothetical protein C9F11_33110 [Streptomyces sp. YIM 121038]|uniref:hypothetical protein n=1 Tax=Streptomyces sp. YIM 121038 TaxID=2136401 RepID=UPI001164716D|nr:hypothetical protein [Streptomyces sp. YIM 121038]QCX80207.1 hypothetical protein C9F11_33110 [Streptomyces sp. YIM 121038]
MPAIPAESRRRATKCGSAIVLMTFVLLSTTAICMPSDVKSSTRPPARLNR